MKRGTVVALTLARTAVPLIVFLLFALWMIQDWRRDPYDPALTGTASYGHNGEGALSTGLGLAGAELFVYYLFTWPFLIRRPRWFFVVPLLGLGGFAAWTLISMMISMHAGGIIMIHLFWLIVLGALLLTEVVLSAVTGLLAGREPREPPAAA